jgi:hypothetical protein
MLTKSAEISEDRLYKYVVTWSWRSSVVSTIVFVTLNPSMVDQVSSDPVILKCYRYAHKWGFGRLHVLNLFAFRTNNPKEIYDAVDPIGPLNDERLNSYLSNTNHSIVFAWGNYGKYMDRGDKLTNRFPGRACYLGLTKDRQPRHPLYLPYSARMNTLRHFTYFK